MSIASDLQTLATNLASILGQINTKLTGKGATAADTLAEVPDKIDDIETGITPTGTKEITQNGNHDVTDYATAYVHVPTGTDTSDANGSASDFAAGKSGYVNGTKIVGTQPERSGSDLSVSGATVTVPAGLYREQATKSVPTTTQATPSMSLDGSTGVVTATASQTAGYVAAGTKTGTLTVTHPNLTAGNIKKGVNIFSTTGTYGASIDETSYGDIYITSKSISSFTITIPDTVTGNVIGIVLRHDGEWPSIQVDDPISSFIAFPTADGTMGVIVATASGASSAVVKNNALAYVSNGTFVITVPGSEYITGAAFDTSGDYTFNFITE